MLLKPGSKGLYVKYLQTGLHLLCFSPGNIDSVYGEATTSAVRKFQAANGLATDGIVGTTTWQKLCDLIRSLQQSLINHGYDTGGIDGIAGDLTYHALIKFQQDNELMADGMVGSATKNKLQLSSNTTISSSSSVLKIGSSGSMVKYLQQLLNSMGYNNIIDGIYGINTKMTVKKFQTDMKNLTADGIVGSRTWEMIFKKYKVNVPGSAAEKMANVAKHEFTWHFTENNKNNITPYGEWYGMNGQAWCAMFVSWCAKQADILNIKVPRFAYCPTGVEWYRNRKKFHSKNSSYTPKVGDTIFFWNNSLGRVAHTGIVIAVNSEKVTAIEGNTGDAVNTHVYAKSNSSIYGYGSND